MRPHLLKFTGIGSYPGDVTINFDDLNAKGLYLIVGPTGAGKTTILDAMTYALYGEVAQDRENALASAYPHSKPPVIEFEFSQGDYRYIVHREPALQGKNQLPSKQWIKEYDSNGEEISVLTNTRTVTDKCRTVVGLSADEFMQVILLPQGKFEEFLMAKGSDKQKVLQTIFETKAYRRIVDKLSTAAKSLEQEVAAEVTNLNQTWAIIDAAIENLSEYKECADLPNPRENLNSTITFIATLADRLDEALRIAQKLHAQTKSDHTAATKEADRFDKGIQLATLRKQFLEQVKYVATARLKLDDHKRAEPVVIALRAQNEAKNSVEQLTDEVARYRTQLIKNSSRFKILSRVAKTLIDATPSASPTTLSAELAKLHTRLNTASTVYESIDELKDQSKENNAESASAQRTANTLERDLAAAQERSKKMTAHIAGARKKLKGQRAAEKAMEDLNTLRDKADVDSKTDILNRATRDLKRVQKIVDAAERAVREANDQRTKELAGVLAATLTDGEACPVCGSTKHPRKARIATTSKRSVETLESKRKSAQKELTNAERDLKEAQTDLAQAKKFRAQLPSIAQQTKIEKIYDELTELGESIDELVDEAELESENVDEIKESLADARKESVRLATEGKNIDKTLLLAQNEVADFGSARAVADGLDVCDDLDEILVDMEKQMQRLVKSEGQVKQAKTEFDRQLAKSGYVNEKKAEASLLIEKTINDFKEAIQKQTEREKTIGQLEAAIGDTPLPKTRPDIEILDAKLLETQQAAEVSSQIAGTVRSARSNIEKAKRDIDRIGPSIEKKRSRADTALDIANVFDKGVGGADGQLSLEVWVQRTLFEEVCLVANEQFRILSGNQYTLTLEQEEGGVSKRRGSGLDIYVLDSNGYTRPVQTLSGGEQFIAALSLALALAEVVQRHSGGIELPCLFIDEGFGGLDLESLDRAIDVLGKIQATGRTIGIITHVQMMQDQLPIGIRVKKSDRGSTLEVLAS